MREALGIRFYTLQEAAAEIGCSVQRLYALRRTGALQAVPIQEPGGARWKYYVTSEGVREALSRPVSKAEAPRVLKPSSDAARAERARELLREHGINV